MNAAMKEKIAVMKQQESTSYKVLNYLDLTSAVVTTQDRKEMCKWGFDIVNSCKIDRFIAVIGISLFDRFLSHSESRVVGCCLRRRRELQLAFITCLVIAIKAHDGMNVNMRFIADGLCESMYRIEEINQMELEILKTLSWRLNGPTSIDYINIFMELLPSSVDAAVAKALLVLSKSNVENSMLDYKLALQSPSITALASIVSSFQVLDFQRSYSIDVRNWLMKCTALVTLDDARYSGRHSRQCELDNDDSSSPSEDNGWFISKRRNILFSKKRKILTPAA